MVLSYLSIVLELNQLHGNIVVGMEYGKTCKVKFVSMHLVANAC